MFIKGARKLLPVLIGTDSVTGHIKGIVMESKSTSTLEDALSRQVAHFNAMGIHFRHIASDREHNIQACEPFVQKLGLTMQRCSSHEHDRLPIGPFAP